MFGNYHLSSNISYPNYVAAEGFETHNYKVKACNDVEVYNMGFGEGMAIASTHDDQLKTNQIMKTVSKTLPPLALQTHKNILQNWQTQPLSFPNRASKATKNL